jgi:hypothetical protein
MADRICWNLVGCYHWCSRFCHRNSLELVSSSLDEEKVKEGLSYCAAKVSLKVKVRPRLKWGIWALYAKQGHALSCTSDHSQPMLYLFPGNIRH